MTTVRLVERPQAGRRLGRHVEHDPRSRAWPYTAPRRSSSLAEVHHRHLRVLDQGDLGSCTGNATVSALNTAPNHHGGERTLTEETAVAVYERATLLDGFPGEYPPDDTGSSGLAACKAAQQLGLLTEYRHAFGLDEAVSALQERPVITGVAWYEGFDEPDGRGLVEVAGQVRGGHEFCVIGYQPARAAADSLVVAVNSWGRGWGLNGRFCFTAGTWGRLLEDSGDVTVPIR